MTRITPPFRNKCYLFKMVSLKASLWNHCVRRHASLSLNAFADDLSDVKRQLIRHQDAFHSSLAVIKGNGDVRIGFSEPI